MNATYFVTDVECNGLDPSRHSMLSFACVACSQAAGIIDGFEAVVSPRSDRSSDPEVMAWWLTQPEAYEHATVNARDCEAVMSDFADWVESHGQPRIFAASPLMLDGPWIDEYCKTYLSTRLTTGPLKQRVLFDKYGIDLPSYLGGLFGWPADRWHEFVDAAPAWWRGNVEHTHRAIDDATGYAHLLLNALAVSAERTANSKDFARNWS